MIKVSENSAGRAGQVVGQLRGMFMRLVGTLWGRVAAEHRCYPPDDGRDWIEVPTASDTTGRYVCPECEQHFLPKEGADAAARSREGGV